MAVAADRALALDLVRRLCVGDVLTRSAERLPDRPAIVDGDVTLTYSELDRWVNAVGRALPKRVHPVDDFPRTGTEKVQKHLLWGRA